MFLRESGPWSKRHLHVANAAQIWFLTISLNGEIAKHLSSSDGQCVRQVKIQCFVSFMYNLALESFFFQKWYNAKLLAEFLQNWNYCQETRSFSSDSQQKNRLVDMEYAIMASYMDKLNKVRNSIDVETRLVFLETIRLVASGWRTIFRRRGNWRHYRRYKVSKQTVSRETFQTQQNHASRLENGRENRQKSKLFVRSKFVSRFESAW